MAFDVRKLLEKWALGPDSPCFAHICYELKMFLQIYCGFLGLMVESCIWF